MIEIVNIHRVSVKELYKKKSYGLSSFTTYNLNDEKKEITYFFDKEKARRRYEELKKETEEDHSLEVEFGSGYAIRDGQKLSWIAHCFDSIPYDQVQWIIIKFYGTDDNDDLEIKSAPAFMACFNDVMLPPITI